jgi:hypothetical protein
MHKKKKIIVTKITLILLCLLGTFNLLALTDGADEQKVIGTWTQSWTYMPLNGYTTVMYGMVTNLETLKTPGNIGPETLPSCDSVTVSRFWTYGGQGCTPPGAPQLKQIKKIVDVTKANGWAGVDVDNECSMNIPNVQKLCADLKEENLTSNYTFIAGAEYIGEPATGPTKTAIKMLKASCDRFVMMCYANEMWDQETIKNVVPQAVSNTIQLVERSEKCILALTTAGLTKENLKFFLDQVTLNNLGGIFVWQGAGDLTTDQMAAILEALTK